MNGEYVLLYVIYLAVMPKDKCDNICSFATTNLLSSKHVLILYSHVHTC